MKVSKEIKKFIRDNCDTLHDDDLRSLMVPVGVAKQVLVAAKRKKKKKAGKAKKTANRLASNRSKKSKNKPKGNYFYKGREWVELRYKALKMSNGCCECCGRSNHNTKHNRSEP